MGSRGSLKNRKICRILILSKCTEDNAQSTTPLCRKTSLQQKQHRAARATTSSAQYLNRHTYSTKYMTKQIFVHIPLYSDI